MKVDKLRKEKIFFFFFFFFYDLPTISDPSFSTRLVTVHKSFYSIHLRFYIIENSSLEVFQTHYKKIYLTCVLHILHKKNSIKLEFLR